MAKPDARQPSLGDEQPAGIDLDQFEPSLGKARGLIRATEPTANGPSSSPETISAFHSTQRAGSSHSSQTADVGALVSVLALVSHIPACDQLKPSSATAFAASLPGGKTG